MSGWGKRPCVQPRLLWCSQSHCKSDPKPGKGNILVSAGALRPLLPYSSSVGWTQVTAHHGYPALGDRDTSQMICGVPAWLVPCCLAPCTISPSREERIQLFIPQGTKCSSAGHFANASPRHFQPSQVRDHLWAHPAPESWRRGVRRGKSPHGYWGLHTKCGLQGNLEPVVKDSGALWVLISIPKIPAENVWICFLPSSPLKAFCR